MDKLSKYLCLIVDRNTKKVYAEYEIEASDWYFARSIAYEQYKKLIITMLIGVLIVLKYRGYHEYNFWCIYQR